MNILLRWSISSIAIIITAYVLPGVFLSGLWSAVWLAVILAIINVALRPILILLTLPINIISLGLFTFVINALLILLASVMVAGFYVSGFIPALFFSILLSIISYMLNNFFGTKK